MRGKLSLIAKTDEKLAWISLNAIDSPVSKSMFILCGTMDMKSVVRAMVPGKRKQRP
jgi:hypothetical protein